VHIVKGCVYDSNRPSTTIHRR